MSTNKTTLEISATNKTEQAFRQVKGSLNDLGNAAGGISGKFSAVSAGIGGAALAVGVTVAGMVKTAIDAADELGKTSQKVGVTVEQLSALKYAGSLADVSMGQLSVGLKQLSKNSLEAAAGSKSQLGAFKALGIEIRNVDGNLKSNNDLVYELADRFAALKDSNLKTAIAMKIFGKSGADLIPLLNSGAEGLKTMRDEAERLGLIIDERTAKAAEQFNDNLTRLKSSASGLGFALATDLLPELTRITDQLVKASQARGGFAGIYEFTKAFLPDPNDPGGFPGGTPFNGTPWQPSKHVGSTLAGMMQQPASPLLAYNPYPVNPSMPSPKAVGLAVGGKQRTAPSLESTLAAYLKLQESGGKPSGKYGRGAKAADDYDLNAAKKDGGLYDWRDILEATEALGNFTAKLQAPELKEPIFNLGFTDVTFQTLEEQQEAAASALQVQQEELGLTADALGELARRYDETFGIRIHSALEGTQLALADYGRMAADSTTQAFLIANDALGGLEDALTDFVTTGKADFKGLVDSILADVARMTIQKSITGPLSNLLSNGLSSLFGGGSLSSRAAKIDIGWLGEYATGTDYVPRTGPYLLHQGEAVITAADNAMNRSSAATAGQSLAISVPVTVNGNNWDERGLRDEIETVVHKWVGRHS